MKIDLHCHSYYSYDGISSPEKLIKSALKKGLDGIAITDHDTITGWKEALLAAKKLNAFLILGEEVKTKEGDILGLFLKEEIKTKTPLEAIKEIKNQGGIAMVPHPFHFLKKFKGNLETYKNLIDGIEVFNSRALFGNDKKALEFVKRNNLAQLAGSDAHYHKCVGDAFTIVERAENLENLKKGILERKTKIEGKRTFFFYLIYPKAERILWKALKLVKTAIKIRR